MPTDAQCLLDGFYYKIGVHGKAFYWSEGWYLSSKSPVKVLDKINSGNPFSLTQEQLRASAW